MTAVHALGHPSSPLPQTSWDASVRNQAGAPAVPADVTTPRLRPPEAPCAAVLTRGDGSDLIVTWTPALVDETHGPAVGFALRYGVAGAWTVVPGASSPQHLSGLPAATVVEVQLQAANAAGASAWSVVSTLITGPNAAAMPSAAATRSLDNSLPDGAAAKLCVRVAAPHKRWLACRLAAALARFLRWLVKQLPLSGTSRRGTGADRAVRTAVPGETGLLARVPWVVRRALTVADYHRMREVGILTERDRVELIEGQLVIKSHLLANSKAPTVDALNRCLVQVVGDRGTVVAHNPLQLDDLCEPEPDLTVRTPREEGCRDPIPRPHEVLLIVEVADNSLDYERLVKRSLYSRHGIPELWIVNCAEQRVEVCRAPNGDDYASISRMGHDGLLEPELLPGAAFPAAMIFGHPHGSSPR